MFLLKFIDDPPEESPNEIIPGPPSLFGCSLSPNSLLGNLKSRYSLSFSRIYSILSAVA